MQREVEVLSMLSRCVHLLNGFQRCTGSMQDASSRTQDASVRARECVGSSCATHSVRERDILLTTFPCARLRKTLESACSKATSHKGDTGVCTTAHATVEIFFVHFRCTTSLLHFRWSLQKILDIVYVVADRTVRHPRAKRMERRSDSSTNSLECRNGPRSDAVH